MTVDEFHPWPRAALTFVASRFLQEISLPEESLYEKLASNMAEVHLSIDVANAKYLAVERRYNYTTPKSFLELIAFYKQLLEKKRSKVEINIERLEKGLTIMEQVKAKVEGLKEDLKVKMVQVEEKKAATNVLIDEVNVGGKYFTNEFRVNFLFANLIFYENFFRNFPTEIGEEIHNF